MNASLASGLRITLRLFFYLLYHPFAWTYDWVAAAVSLGRWKEWVACAVPHLDGDRILEIGHGPGHLQITLQAEGKFVVGLDGSFQMSRQAQRRLERTLARGEPIQPRLVNGVAQALPFPEATFTSVVATFPTEYIVHPDTLAEIYRVLPPGGRLVTIPIAWIRGGNLADRLAAGLFDVTGQAPAWDEKFVLPFERAGFTVRTIIKEVRNSQVLVMEAAKGNLD